MSAADRPRSVAAHPIPVGFPRTAAPTWPTRIFLDTRRRHGLDRFRQNAAKRPAPIEVVPVRATRLADIGDEFIGGLPIALSLRASLLDRADAPVSAEEWKLHIFDRQGAGGRIKMAGHGNGGPAEAQPAHLVIDQADDVRAVLDRIAVCAEIAARLRVPFRVVRQDVVRVHVTPAVGLPLHVSVSIKDRRQYEVVAEPLADQILASAGTLSVPVAPGLQFVVFVRQQFDGLARVVLRVPGETLALGGSQFRKEPGRQRDIAGLVSFVSRLVAGGSPRLTIAPDSEPTVCVLRAFEVRRRRWQTFPASAGGRDRG